jgi:hypothetical protein
MPGQLQRAGLMLASLAVLVSAATPAHAAETVSAADIASVASALVAAGHTATISQDDDGATYILADEGEDEFAVSFDDCEDATASIGCNMLIFYASWEPDVVDADELANRFNQTATIAYAFVDEDDSLTLTLALTTIGGLPTENFAAVIARWQAANDALSAMVSGERAPKADIVVAALNAR